MFIVKHQQFYYCVLVITVETSQYLSSMLTNSCIAKLNKQSSIYLLNLSALEMTFCSNFLIHDNVEPLKNIPSAHIKKKRIYICFPIFFQIILSTNC